MAPHLVIVKITFVLLIKVSSDWISVVSINVLVLKVLFIHRNDEVILVIVKEVKRTDF